MSVDGGDVAMARWWWCGGGGDVVMTGVVEWLAGRREGVGLTEQCGFRFKGVRLEKARVAVFI